MLFYLVYVKALTNRGEAGPLTYQANCIVQCNDRLAPL